MYENKVKSDKIGKHISELRKEKGYTQKSLSEAIFVGEKNNIEMGKRNTYT